MTRKEANNAIEFLLEEAGRKKFMVKTEVKLVQIAPNHAWKAKTIYQKTTGVEIWLDDEEQEDMDAKVAKIRRAINQDLFDTEWTLGEDDEYIKDNGDVTWETRALDEPDELRWVVTAFQVAE